MSQAIEHIYFSKFHSRPFINSMSNMSFTAREISNAANIFNKMLQDDNCSIILTIAGSTGAAGCLHIYTDMIRYNMIDAIVATGAHIVDMDFFESLGFKHYKGNNQGDDQLLNKLKIDRIYDTYIDEEDLQICDHTIYKIANSLQPKAYSSREFIVAMGKYLSEEQNQKTSQNSLIKLALKNDVPIFCPAFTDSSAGFGLVLHQIKNPHRHISLDSIKDFRELTELKIAAGDTGLFMIGGGAPKNFVQDTTVCAEIIGAKNVYMHKYAIQITVADVRDGACSSSTLQEAHSWGKVQMSDEQMVFAEASAVLPLIASDAYHRGHWQKRKKRRFAKLFNKD